MSSSLQNGNLSYDIGNVENKLNGKNKKNKNMRTFFLIFRETEYTQLFFNCFGITFSPLEYDNVAHAEILVFNCAYFEWSI